MSSQVVIRFTDVSKSFTFWSDRRQSLKTWLVDLMRGRFRSGTKRKIEVLKGISFEISEREFVAIMGVNGTGKSTTLKLISGIYEPTSGQIEINGKIAPLIELGAGFDAELSGYENILLNAAVLGFSRSEALSCIDKIIEFSELTNLIDMPIKNYSSGMLVRLGFSIAAHLSAPILLIDEVLAVGDVGFSQKCILKVEELYRAGRTIVLVSHSPESVLQFAKRTIVLSAGTKVFDGPTPEGVAIYQKLATEPV